MRLIKDNFRIYVLPGRVVVFRPFGHYVQFSNVDLALETITRPLSPISRRLEIKSMDETCEINLAG